MPFLFVGYLSLLIQYHKDQTHWYLKTRQRQRQHHPAYLNYSHDNISMYHVFKEHLLFILSDWFHINENGRLVLLSGV